MKILLVRSDLHLNGPGITVVSLARELSAQGHEVKILCGSLANEFLQENIEIHLIPGLDVFQRNLFNAVKGFQKIWTYTQWADRIICFNLYSALLSFSKTLFSSSSPWLFYLAEGSEKFGRYYPGPLLTCSQFMKDKIQTITQRNSKVLHLGLLSEKHQNTLENYSVFRKEIRKKHNISQETKVFCSFGTNGRVKNTNYSLEFMEALEEKHSDNRVLFMIGKGNSNLNSKKGRIIGIEPTSERLKYLCASDFYLQPSHSETFGISVTEAMAFSCIPLIFSGGALKERIEPGKNGFFLSGNLKEDCGKTALLMGNQKDLEKVRINAQEHAWKTCRIEDTVRELLKILHCK